MRAGTSFKDRLFIKLHGTSFLNASIPANAGGASLIVINANNINQPYSAGSVQPYAYQQWMPFYNYFKVFGCKVRVSIAADGANINGNNLNGWQATLVPIQYQTLVNSTTLYDLPRARRRQHLLQYPNRPCVLKGFATTAEVLGVPKQNVRVNDTGYIGSTGTNTVPGLGPTFAWYWLLVLQHPEPEAAAGQILGPLRIKLEYKYYTVLYNRKWLPRSVLPPEP